MRLLLTAALAFFALIAPLRADAPKESGGKFDEVVAGKGTRELIVGKWKSGDAVDAIVEFHKDGKLTISVPQITNTDGKYKFVGEKVMELTLSVPGQAQTVKLNVAITKDTLTIQKVGTDNKETFKRVK